MEYETIGGHQISPIARFIPPYRREEYNRLLWDIQERGQQEPISRHRGLVIDGIHRLQVCVDLGIEPQIVDVDDDVDPMDFVVTRNLLRRELSKNQRACIAHALSVGSPPGRPAQTGNQTKLSIYPQPRAAKACGVSVSFLKNYKRVMSPDSGLISEIQQACWEDKVNASDALNLIGLPEERQSQTLDYVLRGSANTLTRAAERIADQLALQASAEAAADFFARDVNRTTTVHCSAVGEFHQHVEPGSIQVIVTFPPTEERWIPKFKDLGDLGVHALAEDGVMAVMVPAPFTGAIILEMAQTDLRLIDVFDYRHPQRPRHLPHPHRVTSRRMPILLYGKGKTILKPGDDFVDESSPGFAGDLNREQLLDLGLRKLVSRLAKPGDVVCDPVTCGRIGTALGARKEVCSFVGAVEDEKMLERFWGRLYRAVEDQVG